MKNPLFSAIFAVFLGPILGYEYQELWHANMPIDHFSYSDTRTFSLRYLLNTDFWDSRNAGPIFFYCGNEDKIEEFAELTGFMWDIAPEFRAMIVFIEHRYYGKSLPFGNESFANLTNLGKLSSEQALADFAVLIQGLKENVPGASESPVVAIGGSYGGLLAAWMRIKYPHIVIGAVASSAPVLVFEGLSPCSAFYEVTTRTFRNSGKYCDQTIKNSWAAIRRVAKTAAGRSWLNINLNLCKDSYLTMAEHAEIFIGKLAYDWSVMAMGNYPYPSKLFEAVPGWPVKEACKFLTNPFATDTDLVKAVFKADMVYRNYTGSLKCFRFYDEKVPTEVSESARTDLAYRFQTCTEIVTPICRNGTTDMFEPSEWSMEGYSNFCRKKYFGVTPRPRWVTLNYGGNLLNGATNIIFSNGDMDPWVGGSLTSRLPNMDPSIVIINIRDGAHHYDLRGANPLDTSYVRTARNRIKDYLRKWIFEARRESLLLPQIEDPKKPNTVVPTVYAPPFWLTKFPWYQPQEPNG